MDYGIFNMCTDVNACNCARECTDTIRESALKVDSGRKIPCRTEELNLCQRCAGPVLDQLSYIPTPFQFPIPRLQNQSSWLNFRAVLRQLFLYQEQKCLQILFLNTIHKQCSQRLYIKNIKTWLYSTAWPEDTTLQKKLWGTAANVRRTYQFMATASLRLRQNHQSLKKKTDHLLSPTYLFQIDRLTSLLKDAPKKYSIKFSNVRDIPPLSVVHYPAVDTLGRTQGASLQPAIPGEGEEKVTGYKPGPYDLSSWSMEDNRVPAYVYDHRQHAARHGKDFRWVLVSFCCVSSVMNVKKKKNCFRVQFLLWTHNRIVHNDLILYSIFLIPFLKCYPVF